MTPLNCLSRATNVEKSVFKVGKCHGCFAIIPKLTSSIPNMYTSNNILLTNSINKSCFYVYRINKRTLTITLHKMLNENTTQVNLVLSRKVKFELNI